MWLAWLGNKAVGDKYARLRLVGFSSVPKAADSVRLCAEITFQAAACGRRGRVGAVKSSKTQIGPILTGLCASALNSQGWASQEHAQRSFNVPAAFLFKLKTMLKIVIMRKKTLF